ncbi:MAG: hypothetical protein II738_01835 [Clostridia bacterium]|nr:hypothetical protein [Clostridia bacterium]
MNFLKVLLFSLIVAAAGVLPVSGNGHAAVLCSLFGTKPDAFLFLNSAVCLGSAVAVFALHVRTFYAVSREGSIALRARFGKDRFTLPESNPRARRQLRFLLIGLVPCVLWFIPLGKAGLYSLSRRWTSDGKLLAEGLLLLFGGLAMLLVRRFLRRRNRKENGLILAVLSSACLLVGSAFPGLSVTGLTLTAGCAVGAQPHEAFRGALLISFPFLLLSGIADAAKALATDAVFSAWLYLLAFAVAAVATVFAVGFTDKLIKKNNLRPVLFYVCGLGVIITVAGIIQACR